MHKLKNLHRVATTTTVTKRDVLDYFPIYSIGKRSKAHHGFVDLVGTMIKNPLNVAIALACACLTPLGACYKSAKAVRAHAAAIKTSKPAKQADSSAVAKQSAGAAFSSYKAAVYKTLGNAWDTNVRKRASLWLPPNHRANDQRLTVSFAIELKADGQVKRVRLLRSSGYRPFDNSARGTIRRMGSLPKIPQELRDSHVTLVWRFFRDERSCKPEYAELRRKPMSPEEQIERDLAAGDFEAAEHVLQRYGATAGLRAILARYGLQDTNTSVKRLAISLATSAQLLRLLRSPHTEKSLWNLALQVLVDRLEKQHVLALLPKKAGSSDVSVERYVAILSALRKLAWRPGSKQLVRYLSDSRHRIVLAALALTDDAKVIAVAMQNSPNVGLRGALGARLAHLGQHDQALENARKGLASKSSEYVLEVLKYHPVADLADDLAAIVRDSRRPRTTRVAAIWALASARVKASPLYLALKIADTKIQIAAAQALSRFPGNKLAASYRLADVAYHQRGPVGVAATAAIAKIGHPRFVRDLSLLVIRLKPVEKLHVIPHLPGFGADILPLFKRLLASKDAQVRDTSAAALGRIPGPKAEALLMSHKENNQAESLAADTEAEEHMSDSDEPPLKHLLRFAVDLAPNGPSIADDQPPKLRTVSSGSLL